MPLNIKHPYADTPYDVLSHPDVGTLSPDSPQKTIRVQQAEIIRLKIRPPDKASEAGRFLVDLSKRLGLDVFLRSTLNRSADLAELAEQGRDMPPPAPPSVNWTEGLTFWIEPPVDQIQLQPIEITRLSSYDDPRADLLAVTFDN